MKRTAFVFILLSLFLAGCVGRGEETTDGGPSGTSGPYRNAPAAFFVTKFSPDNRDTVSPDGEIGVWFNRGVDCNTVKDGIEITPRLDGNWTCDGAVASYKYSSALEGEYSVRVTTRVKSADEVSVNATAWKFTVAADAPPGNHAPIITHQSFNMTVAPGGMATFVLTGADVDRDGLTFACFLVSGPAVPISVVSTGMTGASVSWVTATGVSGHYQVECQASDGTTTSNVVLLEAVATSTPGTAGDLYVSPSVFVMSGSSAHATLNNGILVVSSLGSERWFIQVFYWMTGVTAGETYEVTIPCTGGGVFDSLLQHEDTPYTHYYSNEDVACDGNRVLYFRASATDTDVRLSFMPRKVGTYNLSTASIRRVL